MRVVQPIDINFAHLYPPWQLRSKRALQYKINPFDNSMEIAEVRPSMVSRKTLLGWTYQLSAVIKGDETALKDVNLSILCLFQYGPIVILEKTLYDVGPEHERVLIRGRNNWWQLDENEEIKEFNFVKSTDDKSVYAIQFVVIDKHTNKPKYIHTTTKQSLSEEF